jgi:ATP-dependent helicase/nuclease subunit A
MMNKSVAEPAVADAAVREEVLDTRRSFIVQAPAGSGKTELLMQRYLALLATVDEPESVLAITFTKKAASEMRNRIVAALVAAQREDPVRSAYQQRTRDLALRVLARDRERNWKLLDGPERMQIRTVDAFCESLARRTPLLAGIGGALNITEMAAPLYEEAARRTIDLLGSEDGLIAAAMMTMLAHVDNNIIESQRLFHNMLEKRDRWLRLIEPGSAGGQDLSNLRQTLEHSLEIAVRDQLKIARAQWKKHISPAEEQSLLRLARFAASTAEVEDRFKQFVMWTDVPASELADLERWREWKHWLMTDDKWRSKASAKLGFPPVGRNPEFRTYKDEYEHVLFGLREEQHPDLAEALDKAAALPFPRYTDDQWDLVCALFHILPHAVENLKAVFLDRGLMDFAQISQAALEALRTRGSGQAHNIRHVLVDEFQDTSTAQVELLTRLTADWQPDDGRTLFVVGDPMQSIYAFRDAEVVLFDRTRARGVGAIPLLSRKLEVNFRSQAGLVGWFNQTFRHLMKETNDLRGAVSYEACTAMRPGLEASAVEIHPAYSEDWQAEAEQVVTSVRDALENTTGNVAILVRARTHLPAIIEALRHAEIRYRGVDLDPLSTRQAVLDVDALAQVLEHIGNRTAWLAVLRAPWCGLSLADLWELCGDDKYSPVITLLGQRVAQLSAEGQRRVARILPVLTDAVSQFGRVPLRPLLENTWVSLGGPAAVRPGVDGEADLRDIHAYFDLVQRHEIGGALPDRAMFERRLQELYAAPDTSDNIRLEIMTIFQAKGLEFDTVIVPGLGRSVGGDPQSLLYWRERVLEGESHLLLAPMDAVAPDNRKAPPTPQKYLLGIEAERNREEGKRLLYVAATRARHKLHLFGHVGVKGKADSDSLLALLMAAPHVADEFERAAPPQEEEGGLEIAAAALPERQVPVLRRLPVEWQMPAAPTPLHPAAIRTSAVAEEEPHTFNWVSDTLRRVGTVTHAFLQRIATEGLDAWSADRVDQSASLIKLALLSEGVAGSELPSAIQKIVRALRAAVTEDHGRWILASHAEAASEYELSGLLDGRLIRVKLDRTFVDQDGTRWIIDYKTADKSGGSMQAFLAEQEEKYRPDLKRYASIMNAFDGRPVRAGLYLPLLASWREITLDVTSDGA